VSKLFAVEQCSRFARWWRAVALSAPLVVTWAGCSDETTNHAEPRRVAGAGAGGDAGSSAAKGGAGALAGEAGMGETAGQGALGGGGGLPAGGSSAGLRGVPTAWTCISFAYGDGQCDCGCGVPDKDCAGQELAQCESCNGFGSCNLAECPGRIDPADVATCLPPPDEWTCTAAAYGDGKVCDCGCGIRDSDCPSTEVAVCEACATNGSCASGPCPSALAPDDNTRCDIPSRWACEASLYGDGTCHCGCGIVDTDCPDATAEVCEACDESSCSRSCQVEPDDNAHCPEPPSGWGCSARLYHDGIRCDCGCGAVDPDCESSDLDACDECNSPGSCSAQPCPGLISPAANARCEQPPAPDEWTCNGAAYADGIACDCGCGVADLDCPTADLGHCVRCLACGGHGTCMGTIDTEDTTQCAPPPSDWICSAEAFRDEVCDCGCGIPDVYCQGIELLYVCGNYPVEGCSAGNFTHIDPNHNALCSINVPSEWTCDRSFYDDGLCDCGCGAFDLDCPSSDVSDCETCDEDGSCSESACPGTVDPDDNSSCSG
jgi:hypothetical protein